MKVVMPLGLASDETLHDIMRKWTKPKQQTIIVDNMKKQEKELLDQYERRFLFTNGIPFNVALNVALNAELQVNSEFCYIWISDYNFLILILLLGLVRRCWPLQSRLQLSNTYLLSESKKVWRWCSSWNGTYYTSTKMVGYIWNGNYEIEENCNKNPQFMLLGFKLWKELEYFRG